MFLQIGPRDYIPIAEIYSIYEDVDIEYTLSFFFFDTQKRIKILYVKMKQGARYAVSEDFEDIVLLWAKKHLETLDLTGEKTNDN